MMNYSCLVVLLTSACATLFLSSCHLQLLLSPFSYRAADESDPEVRELLKAARQFDRESIGFTRLPDSGTFGVLRIKPFRATPKPWKDVVDVALFDQDHKKSRSWYFSRVGDSYMLVCEGEMYHGPRVTQHPEVRDGACFREYMDLQWATQDACDMKEGLLLELADSDGRREIGVDEIPEVLEQWENVEYEVGCCCERDGSQG